jgi:hypothetical protein
LDLQPPTSDISRHKRHNHSEEMGIGEMDLDQLVGQADFLFTVFIGFVILVITAIILILMKAYSFIFH